MPTKKKNSWLTVSHTYNGKSFYVAKNLSDSEKDAYCATLLADKRKRENPGNEHFEVERMPEDARDPNAPKRGRGRPKGSGKVNPSPKTGNAARDALTRAVNDAIANGAPIITEITPADDFYSQGFYRIPCAKCGKGITRTGARGRAPKYHADCKPVTE